MAYHNNWEDCGLRRIFTGNTSGKEVLTANISLQGDLRFDHIQYIINDFTEIVAFEVSDIEISQIVAIDNIATIINKKIKIAIVATLEPLLTWIDKYIEQMQNSPFECQLFNNIDNAEKWIFAD